MLRVGLFLSAQHRANDDLAARFREHIAQVELARDCGFRTVMAGQHFLASDLQMFQPLALLARIAAAAGEMRIVTGILLLRC